MRPGEYRVRELIDALNAQLVALERRSRGRTMTDADRLQVDLALQALDRLAAAYVEAGSTDRDLIHRRAGFAPEIRLSLRDILRRRLTWFPKRRGDYRDALWFAALTYADDVRRAMTPASLRLALAALCLEGGRYDDRDTLEALHRLRRSALEAGIDPEPAFQEAAEWVGDRPIAPNRTLTMRMLLSR